MNTNPINTDFIKKLSYPDFVGFVNQWNTLPGAFVTLNKWALFSRMNKNSLLLQVACTTGFQSRELCLMTKCKALGFDISKIATDMANYNKKTYTPKARLKYFCADGMEYEPKKLFTHVAIGAGLHFFPDPDLALNRVIGFLKDGGYLLASPFFCKKEVPEHLREIAKSTFGVYPTFENYKQKMWQYRNLEILHEDIVENIAQETPEELSHYCASTIDRATDIHNITDREVIDCMYNRLLAIKETSNMLRPYQGYVILVLRYRKSTYSKRFVELF